MMAMHVRHMFIMEALGSQAKNPVTQEKFISCNAPTSEQRAAEIEAIKRAAKAIEKAKDDGVSVIPDGQEEGDEISEFALTVFPRDKHGMPIIWAYQLRGFFKEAAGALKRTKDPQFLSSGVPSHKKTVDNGIFVGPNEITLHLPGDPKEYKPEICRRTLRAGGKTGERITIIESETVPAGTWFEYDVVTMANENIDIVREWLKYGLGKGLLQWRNSGRGTFHTAVSEAVKCDDWNQVMYVLYGLAEPPEFMRQLVLPPKLSP